MNAFLDKCSLPRLTQKHVTILETPIGTGEIREASNRSLKTKHSSRTKWTHLVKFHKKFELYLLPYLQKLFEVFLKEVNLPTTWVLARLIWLTKQD